MGRWAVPKEMYFLIPNCNFSHILVFLVLGCFFTIGAIFELYLTVFLF